MNVVEILLRILRSISEKLDHIKLLSEKREGVLKLEKVLTFVVSIALLTTICFKFYCSLDFDKEPSIDARPRLKFLPGLPCFCKHWRLL